MPLNYGIFLSLSFFPFYFCKPNSLPFALVFIYIANGKAAEYGALKEGYMFECTTGLSRMYVFFSLFQSMHTVNRSSYEKFYVACRLLSSPTCPVLDALGKKLSFEIAVGLNGRVWVCRHRLLLVRHHMFFLFAYCLIGSLYALPIF